MQEISLNPKNIDHFFEITEALLREQKTQQIGEEESMLLLKLAGLEMKNRTVCLWDDEVMAMTGITDPVEFRDKIFEMVSLGWLKVENHGQMMPVQYSVSKPAV